MSYLLDTDICSAFLRGDRRVFGRFIQHSGGLHISILSLAELYSWVYLADQPSRREQSLLDMLSDVAVLPVDDDVVQLCGRSRAMLQRQGVRVPTLDLLIASTSLVRNLTLVTHNLRHFCLVPNLRIEDWLAV